MPIQPTAHYAMGGIPTDTDGRVVIGPDEEIVPGLYAAGECACVSVHGANRLGTNSLLDLVVFGRRAGADAARHAKETPQPAPAGQARARARSSMLDGILGRTAGDNGGDIRKELQDNMFDLAFVVRTEAGLAKMQEILGGLRERYDRVAITDKGAIYNTDLMEVVELGYLLDCADTLVAGALVPHREPRRPLPRRLPAARRRELAEAHARLPPGRRLDPDGVQAREARSLRADGEEVLMATAAEALNASDAPTGRREARHDGAHGPGAPVQPGGVRGLLVGRVDAAGRSRSTGSSRCCTRSSGTTTAR